jgi:hypothetical protein
MRIHHGAVSDRQLSGASDLALHLAGAIAVPVALHVPVGFSVGPATLAYPVKEYYGGEDQRPNASTNGSTVCAREYRLRRGNELADRFAGTLHHRRMGGSLERRLYFQELGHQTQSLCRI